MLECKLEIFYHESFLETHHEGWGTYVALFPGVLKKKPSYDTIFLDERVFALIEKPFFDTIPRFFLYGYTPVKKEYWLKIINKLWNMSLMLGQCNDLDQIKYYLRFMGKDVEKQFEFNFNDNRQQLIRLICELCDWLNIQLKSNINIISIEFEVR